MELTKKPHERGSRTVANGAGRVVCSCGWEGPVVADSHMYDADYKSCDDHWNEHIAATKDPAAAAIEAIERLRTEKRELLGDLDKYQRLIAEIGDRLPAIDGEMAAWSKISNKKGL